MGKQIRFSSIQARSATKQGVFVYAFNKGDLKFKKFRSITDAVRFAVRIPGAYILYNGIEIKYKMIAPNEVAYMLANGKTKIIDIVKY